jgi:hypothetical protein
LHFKEHYIPAICDFGAGLFICSFKDPVLKMSPPPFYRDVYEQIPSFAFVPTVPKKWMENVSIKYVMCDPEFLTGTKVKVSMEVVRKFKELVYRIENHKIFNLFDHYDIEKLINSNEKIHPKYNQ